MPLDVCPGRPNKLDLILIKMRQGSQILIVAVVREGSHALVAVVEMGQDNVRSCTTTPVRQAQFVSLCVHDAKQGGRDSPR